MRQRFTAFPAADVHREFATRVRKLVDEIVEGDFDQIELYAAKVADLERFIAEQSEGAVEQTGAAVVLDQKESELRIQQRYMLQLQASLAPLQLHASFREDPTSTVTQAVVDAALAFVGAAPRQKKNR